MKKLSVIIATVLVLGVANISKAQDTESANHDVSINIPDFAILDIESAGDADVTLSFDEAELEAGAEINLTGISNNDLWLNYTALADNNTRKIEVSIDKEIDGIDLNLEVDADENLGEGAVGSLANSSVTLSKSAETIISGIGSCYTGDGANKGHNLTYSMAVNDLSAIEAGSHTVTVTYTITEE